MINNTFAVTLKTTASNLIQTEATINTTVLQLKTVIHQKTQHPIEKIKLVYKGKIIQDTQTMGSLDIKEPATIMVVLRKNEKKDEQTQGINPVLSNIQTGLGDFNPVGFGNFGIMNQPGYMSALSSVASPEKMEQMMDDPFYQKMIEQMMNDPEIMLKAIQSNPQTKQMLDSNPMMKMMFNNPELMKTIMTPENMKMALEMKKKGGMPGMDSANPFSNQGFNMGGGMGGMGGMGGFGGMGNPFANLSSMGGFGNPFGPVQSSTNNQPQTSTASDTTTQNNNPQAQNPFGSNPFGMNPFSMNPYMNAFGNPYMSNPFFNPMMSSFMNQSQNNQNSTTSSGSNGGSGGSSSPGSLNPFSLVPPQQNLQQKFKVQLQTLASMGFSDKDKNIEALKICFGNVQAAIQRLIK